MRTVRAVFEMDFDLAHKHHVLPMPVCETDKFCPHYGEVVILSGVFDTHRHGQWCSQDIAVARAQHGHTMFVRTSARSAEAQKLIGHPPPGILQPPREVLRPYTVAKCTANLRMMSV